MTTASGTTYAELRLRFGQTLGSDLEALERLAQDLDAAHDQGQITDTQHYNLSFELGERIFAAAQRERDRRGTH